MFVTDFIYTKKLLAPADVTYETDQITFLEWDKVYTLFKNCVDMNYILNYVREIINDDEAIYQCNYFSITLENAMNFQNTYHASGLVDLYSNNGYNLILQPPVEIDMETYQRHNTGFWIKELVSHQTSAMFNRQVFVH